MDTTGTLNNENPTFAAPPGVGLLVPEQRGPATWAQDYGAPLYRFAMAQVRDADAAAEVVQETFVAALESGTAYEGRSSFRTWLLGIARHKALDYFRLRSRERASGDLSAEADVSQETRNAGPRSLFLSTPAVDPEDAATSAALGRALETALLTLSPRLARAFTLCALQGLDGHEACAILGCTRSTLWVRLHRARRKLRQALLQAGVPLAS